MWKKKSSGISKNFLFLTWKFQTSLIILQTCVEVAFVLHQSKAFKKFWKYYEYVKSYMLSTSHEYVVGVTIFFQYVSLIELNAWKDKWFVVIKKLYKGKRKAKKVKKGEGKKEMI